MNLAEPILTTPLLHRLTTIDRMEESTHVSVSLIPSGFLVGATTGAQTASVEVPYRFSQDSQLKLTLRLSTGAHRSYHFVTEQELVENKFLAPDDFEGLVKIVVKEVQELTH